jgi:hypothetical protein
MRAQSLGPERAAGRRGDLVYCPRKGAGWAEWTISTFIPITYRLTTGAECEIRNLHAKAD